MGLRSYLSQMQALLPRGRAWTRERDAELTAFLHACSDELDRVDARVMQLLEEMDPRTATELIPEWEEAVGLPDEGGTPATIEERRAAVHARLVGRGAVYPSFYVQLAAALGYAITIEHYPQPYTCTSACTDALYDWRWRYAWKVVTTSQGATQDARLERVIERYNQDHAVVAFEYV